MYNSNMTAKREEFKQVSFSLLRKTPKTAAIKRKNHGSRYCLIAISILLISILICGFVLVIHLSDFAKPVRCFTSNVLDLKLQECREPTVLESLNGEINSSKASVLAGQQNATDEDLRYISLSEHTWETAWEMLQDTKGWEAVAGSNLNAGRVVSKTYKGIGLVFKMQAYVDFQPENLHKLLIVNVEDTPSWNSAVTTSEIVYNVTEHIDIHYMVTRPLAGGLIASRDYVILRNSKSRDNITMSSGISTNHNSVPERDDMIRGRYMPGGVIFRPVPGTPDQCFMEWALGIDFGGWIPQWAVNRAVPSLMLQFLATGRKRIEGRKKEMREKQ